MTLSPLMRRIKPFLAADADPDAAAAAIGESPVRLSDMTDEQIQRMTRETLQDAAAIEVACKEVAPIMGEYFPKQDDTAESIYRAALDACGVKLDGIEPDSLRAMVRLMVENRTGKMAGDAAPRRSSMLANIPNLDRIRRA